MKVCGSEVKSRNGTMQTRSEDPLIWDKRRNRHSIGSVFSVRNEEKSRSGILSNDLDSEYSEPRDTCRRKRHSFSFRIGFSMKGNGSKIGLTPVLSAALRHFNNRRTSKSKQTCSVGVQTSPVKIVNDKSYHSYHDYLDDEILLQSAAVFDSYMNSRKYKSNSGQDRAKQNMHFSEIKYSHRQRSYQEGNNSPSHLLKNDTVSAPLASSESLAECDFTSIDVQNTSIPQIVENRASPSEHSQCENEDVQDFYSERNGITSSYTNLLSVTQVFSRKSSTGDSAVDLKFVEEDSSAVSFPLDLSGDTQSFHSGLSSLDMHSKDMSTPLGTFCDGKSIGYEAEAQIRRNAIAMTSAEGCNERDYEIKDCGAILQSPKYLCSISSRCTTTRICNVDKTSPEKCCNLMSSDATEEERGVALIQTKRSTLSREDNENVAIGSPATQLCGQIHPWIQLAGHPDNFRCYTQGTILKKHSNNEEHCLQRLMRDILRPYVPEYKGEVNKDEEKFIRMQDLLVDMDSPNLMDCKIGTRTYLEDEIKQAKSIPPRNDLYKKMIDIDPDAPTSEEHAAQAITKLRYMQWRETLSSTSTLGFRIEGVKKSVGFSSRDFKKMNCKQDVKLCFKDFTDGSVTLLKKYANHLRAIRGTLEISPFFRRHEMVGSSLLFVHDKSLRARIWIIDFGKSVPLPPNVCIDHHSPWEEGNHEDGYLIGLDNLIELTEELYHEIETIAEA